ncbi:MAG: hypothetical protein U9Q04_03920 [Campylobacterota bacterium]|nr:hypothetical protein [Campylobacterota bacterium]
MKKESHETKKMIIVFKDLLHKELGGDKNPTEEEIKKAILKLKNVGKIAALMPLVVLPGSVLTIPLLVKLGKRYNIEILPSNNSTNKDTKKLHLNTKIT